MGAGCVTAADVHSAKEGDIVRTLKKVFIILSFLLILWLVLCAACYPNPAPRTGTPEWLTLEHRQEGY